MLIDRVLADLDVPDERTGNPLRGSRLGRCARQSAYMLFPDAYPPDPLPARAKLVFQFGNLVHDFIRAEFRRVIKGEWGMEEERFHFKVPLTVEQANNALYKIERRELRATIQDGPTLRDFTWPHLISLERVAGYPVMRRGLWLDLAEPAIYVPLHLDGLTELPKPFGLACVEIKSMATGSFRRAVQGHVEYSYRVQMATALDATGLDTQLYVACRKDTCHFVEVLYSKRSDTVRVEISKQGEILRRLFLSRGAAFETWRGFSDLSEWEAATVEHPFEPALVEHARDRVRAILMATPASLPEREYGPDFTPKRCEGCEGTGKTLKRHKPHSACDGKGYTGGEEAEAPWQCRYCPSFMACYSAAAPRLEFDKEGKPHYVFERAKYEASGITWRGKE